MISFHTRSATRSNLQWASSERVRYCTLCDVIVDYFIRVTSIPCLGRGEIRMRQKDASRNQSKGLLGKVEGG